MLCFALLHILDCTYISAISQVLQIDELLGMITGLPVSPPLGGISALLGEPRIVVVFARISIMLPLEPGKIGLPLKATLA